jgi:ankyrin repeat protein
MIDNGSNVNETNRTGNTPLHLACQAGYLNIVQYLVQFGQALVNIGKNDGATPLHLACSMGHYGIVQYLVEYGGLIHNYHDRSYLQFY